jgi:hypothetical protein
MLIYNITMQTEWQIHDEWLLWMNNTYVPLAMGSGCFEKYQFMQLLEVDDTEGPTYALQLYATSKADYNRYLELHLPQIEQQSFEKWEGSLVSFATLMKVVE